MWLLPLRASLWLDETIAYWMIKDGARTAIARSAEYGGGHTLYHLLLWATSMVAGTSEVALRLPSLLAMAGATVLLSRLAARLAGAEAARLAVVVFVSSQGIAFAAADARVYALATLLAVAALLALVRWLDGGRPIDGVLYALSAALTFHAHYLFAPLLAVHALYAAWRRRRGDTVVGPRALAAVGVLLMMLLLPAIPGFFTVFGTRDLFVWAETPTATEVVEALAPPVLVYAVLAGAALAAASIGLRFERGHREARRDAWLLPALWFVVPPLVLLAVSILTPEKIFVPRYFLGAVPGLALLVGGALARVEPAPARGLIATAIVAVAIAACPLRRHGWEDWRAAAAAAGAASDGTSTPVLVQGGAIESASVSWLSGPRAQVALAPMLYYPIPGTLVPLPLIGWRDDRDAANRYLENVAATLLEPSARFLVLTRKDEPEMRAWFDGRLAGRGFRSRRLGRYGHVSVVLFERQPG
jgi:mannosyltransferase